MTGLGARDRERGVKVEAIDPDKSNRSRPAARPEARLLHELVPTLLMLYSRGGLGTVCAGGASMFLPCSTGPLAGLEAWGLCPRSTSHALLTTDEPAL